MEELASLIDKPITSPEAQQFLSRFNLTQEIIPPREDGMREECFLTDKAGGIRIEIRPDGRIGTIFLHAFGKDGFGQFQFPIHRKITFSSTHEDVISCLGQPDASTTLDPPIFGVTSWAKYFSPTHSTHFSFGNSGISSITIMPSDWRPGDNGGD